MLGGVCSSVAADIMAKADIGIEESKEMRDLLGPLVTDALPALLPAPAPAAEAHHHTGGAQGPTVSGIPLEVGPGLLGPFPGVNV